MSQTKPPTGGNDSNNNDFVEILIGCVCGVAASSIVMGLFRLSGIEALLYSMAMMVALYAFQFVLRKGI